MPRKWFTGNIINIQDLSPTTKSFKVEVQDKETFHFKAGQFVTMDLPIGEKRLERWRSYSIANAPDKSNILEFCIVRTDPGFATKYLFEEVKIGTSIKFKGPEGMFCLPENMDKPIIMICTGTGVAPFRSMICDLTNHKKTYKSIHLIFGTRNIKGILYLNEFEKLARENPGFSYSVALSRETYNGFQGYVHPIYQEAYAQYNEENLFYLCGWQKMVDEATKNLLNLGYQKNQIITELYG